MHDYITQIVENKVIFYSFLVLVLLIFLRLGWGLGSSFTRKRTKKQFKEIEKEKNIFQRENKKMWDEEKKSLLDKNQNLEDISKRNEKRLEEYRRKLSGMGILNFGESKKRSDILYSLVLENVFLSCQLYNNSYHCQDYTQNSNIQFNKVRNGVIDITGICKKNCLEAKTIRKKA